MWTETASGLAYEGRLAAIRACTRTGVRSLYLHFIPVSVDLCILYDTNFTNGKNYIYIFVNNLFSCYNYPVLLGINFREVLFDKQTDPLRDASTLRANFVCLHLAVGNSYIFPCRSV